MPELNDYNWEDKKSSIVYFDDTNLNIAHNIIDIHAKDDKKDKKALIYISEDDKVQEFTFSDLSKISNKYANLLSKHVINKGDRVFIFLPRIPELYISFIGIVKTGAIAGTMFSAFAKDALKDRLLDSGATALFTTKELYERVQQVKDELPELKQVFIVDDDEFQKEVNSMPDTYEVYHTRPEDYAFMLYTSGTTGKPKGIVHAHAGLIQQKASAELVLDLKESDIYWCTADPGWVTGIVYDIITNWAIGVTTVVHGGRFDPEKWYQILQDYKVTVWYTAPTAVRMLMSKGTDLVKKYDLSNLRHLASVGEPLNPEAVIWGKEAFGKMFHDTWWQTETGSMMIVNTPDLEIKPGSMGKPLPWIKAKILDDEGNDVGTNKEGNLCLLPPWPSIMRTVWHRQEKYDSYFLPNGWYLSGDHARLDDDGYFWFIGRADDVIKTSGERVGPFEVESALVDFPGVIEAGVIGKPDEVRGEIIKAFIVLKPGVEKNDKLIEDIQAHVKKTLAGHAYPREIEFVDKLPKTRSGKIMRRILKAKELGQDIGDTSTLEDY